MEGRFSTRWRFSRIMAMIQIIIGMFVIFISVASLHRFYNVSNLLHFSSIGACHKFDAITEGILHEGGYAPFDLKALSEQIDKVLSQLSELQEKLESTAIKLSKNAKKGKDKKVSTVGENITLAEFQRFLEDEVIRPLYDAHISLRLTRIPRPEDAVLGAHSGALTEDPLVNYFTIEETRKYITAKINRDDVQNVYGLNKTYNTIGHTCVLMKEELEKYMNYDVGSYCGDDWDLGQKLMLGGCDPLPRRRCLARASKLYQRPLPINESLWTIPDDGNVRWGKYKCHDFKCLSYRNPKRGYNKCVGCFDMEKEKLKWVSNGSLVDFMIKDVLNVKPGEIRIGLDVSVTTGTFAARMREFNVTIVSTALNIGAPFSDTIALRGLIPLYTTMSQRLPFFDNTMDLIHTSNFLDGWIELQLMDFILFDWDRILRPGGLLWVDRFSCARKDLDDYMYMFLQFRYKKHKWVVSFKSKTEVYLSALLEKPPRSL
ncbi:hypothetical protein LUZ63_015641 [Rhynchospora breviuscula]|uniref:S-adenosyl-L-methionine-dependent methyltransferase n=1 Tax=Rhynchospora breviuscula TaxID=2022672 RepID=A0A9Q0CCQ0_9POAL|nr:hypothetical protein LUZ63_015641 [Rhynchospora breviuscula]